MVGVLINSSQHLNSHKIFSVKAVSLSFQKVASSSTYSRGYRRGWLATPTLARRTTEDMQTLERLGYCDRDITMTIISL